ESLETATSEVLKKATAAGCVRGAGLGMDRGSSPRQGRCDVEIDVFPAEELKGVFRVLRTALNPSGSLEPSEKAFLETYAKITGWQLRTEPLSIRPDQVQVEGAHPRKRLVQLASLAVLLSNPVRPASVQFVMDLAARLAVLD